MQGHTDRATVNQRKPLTAGMLAFLDQVDRRAFRDQAHFSTAQKNRARALRERGLLEQSLNLTPAGAVVLAAWREGKVGVLTPSTELFQGVPPVERG